MYNTQLTENTNKDYIKLLNERAKLADEMKLQVDKDKMVNLVFSNIRESFFLGLLQVFVNVLLYWSFPTFVNVFTLVFSNMII